MGPESDPALRNLIGVIGKVGLEIGGKVIKCRPGATRRRRSSAASRCNPINAIPGGMSKPLNAEERNRLDEICRFMVEFGKFTLKLFHDVVLANKAYVDLILNGPYYHETYSMGLVDDQNRVNFYDGKVRVVDPEGKELCKYAAAEYVKHIAERVEPWSYLKFPYLKQVGWKGFVDGKDSGVYRATPQSRLNVADGMNTPAGPGGLRGVLRDAHRGPERQQAGAPHPGHPLGTRRSSC